GRSPPLHAQPARTRPGDPDQRRDAPEQLPALAGCVCGDLRHQDFLAGFSRHPSARSHPGIPETRTTLRRIERTPQQSGPALAHPRTMKRVLTAVVLIPLVLLAVFRAPLWLFALLVAGIIILALREYLNIAEAAGIKPFQWLTYAVSMTPIIAVWAATVIALQVSTSRRYTISPIDLPALRTLSIFPVMAPVIFGIALLFRKDLHGGLAPAAVSAFGVFYVAGSLSRLITLRADLVGNILVIFVLLSVWAGDTAAYYVGRSIGKHKLAP